MKTLMFEIRLVLHSRLALAAVALLLLLSSVSVWSGLQAVSAQRATLERIAASHHADVQALAHKHANAADAGQVAYDTPHLTTSPPSALAFAAIGQRDLQPFALRVRLLGLHSQLYESESINPELAMAGRFDFAFLLVYLSPLFVIALMHDLVTGEREAGRLRLLSSLPTRSASLWRRRIALRYALLALALLAPLGAGIAVAGAGLAALGQLALVAALYLAFWFGIAALVGARARTGASSATILLACHVGLTMIVPTAIDAAIARTVPVSKGVELALEQRQQVHTGWDLPKAVTFDKFFRTHPEWKDTPPVTGRFHWKWYYAMHQAGDQAVAAQVARYRASLQAREDWTARAGLLLAPVNVQVLLHRLADTDLRAQLAYQERIGRYHTELRQFFYPYFFNEQAFGNADFGRMPTYTATAPRGELPAALLAALALLALAAVLAGMRQLRKLGTADLSLSH